MPPLLARSRARSRAASIGHGIAPSCTTSNMCGTSSSMALDDVHGFLGPAPSHLSPAPIFALATNPTTQGFHAKPMLKDDNSTDLLRWECGLPGPVSESGGPLNISNNEKHEPNASAGGYILLVVSI